MEGQTHLGGVAEGAAVGAAVGVVLVVVVVVVVDVAEGEVSTEIAVWHTHPVIVHSYAQNLPSWGTGTADCECCLTDPAAREMLPLGKNCDVAGRGVVELVQNAETHPQEQCPRSGCCQGIDWKTTEGRFRRSAWRLCVDYRRNGQYRRIESDCLRQCRKSAARDHAVASKQYHGGDCQR